MADSRILKLAQVITEYSTEIKPGDRVYITASPAAQPLTLAVIEQVIKRGGLPHITAGSGYHHLDLVPGALELMLKYGSEEQLQYLNPFERMAVNEVEVDGEVLHAMDLRSLVVSVTSAGLVQLNETDAVTLTSVQTARPAASETLFRMRPTVSRGSQLRKSKATIRLY